MDGWMDRYLPQVEECKPLRATKDQFTASLWPLGQTIFKRIGQDGHRQKAISTRGRPRLQGISKLTLHFCHLLLFKILFSSIIELD